MAPCGIWIDISQIALKYPSNWYVAWYSCDNSLSIVKCARAVLVPTDRWRNERITTNSFFAACSTILLCTITKEAGRDIPGFWLWKEWPGQKIRALIPQTIDKSEVFAELEKIGRVLSWLTWPQRKPEYHLITSIMINLCYASEKRWFVQMSATTWTSWPNWFWYPPAIQEPSFPV